MPFDEWPVNLTKENPDGRIAEGIRRVIAGDRVQLLSIYQDNVEEALSGVKGANSVKVIGRTFRPWRRLQPR